MGSLEQKDAELLFEGLHLSTDGGLGDGGLGDAEFARGERETAVPGGGLEAHQRGQGRERTAKRLHESPCMTSSHV
jgi:hypothetical protein